MRGAGTPREGRALADQPLIEGYRDLQPIARGGFGMVYRAHQQRFGRIVALKVLDVDSLTDRARRRFERECLAMGGLSWHPNVVALHDSGITPDGRPYLVMEYLEAGSLGDRLDQGPLAWPLAVRAGVEVAGALGAAHAAGTLHRDLKPENLLVGPFGETKLGDFGIAAVEGAARTAGGAVSLTIAHVAPEVLRGAEPDERSDVYSLASTLHTLVTGAPPFDPTGSLGDVVARIVHTPAPPAARPGHDGCPRRHHGGEDLGVQPAGVTAGELTSQEQPDSLAGTEQAGDLVGPVHHGTEAAQDRAQRSHVGDADETDVAVGDAAHGLGHHPRLGQARTAVDHDGERPRGEVETAPHVDVPTQPGGRGEQLDELGVEAPRIDRESALEAAAEQDRGGSHHATSAEPSLKVT